MLQYSFILGNSCRRSDEKSPRPLFSECNKNIDSPVKEKKKIDIVRVKDVKTVDVPVDNSEEKINNILSELKFEYYFVKDIRLEENDKLNLANIISVCKDIGKDLDSDSSDFEFKGDLKGYLKNKFYIVLYHDSYIYYIIPDIDKLSGTNFVSEYEGNFKNISVSEDVKYYYSSEKGKEFFIGFNVSDEANKYFNDGLFSNSLNRASWERILKYFVDIITKKNSIGGCSEYYCEILKKFDKDKKKKIVIDIPYGLKIGIKYLDKDDEKCITTSIEKFILMKND